MTDPYGQQQPDPYAPYGTPPQGLPPRVPQPGRPAKKQQKGSTALGCAVMAVVAAAIGIGAYALLHGGGRPAAAPAPASSPAASSPAAPPSCADQVAAWHAGPGGTWFGKVDADLGTFGRAASAGDVASAERLGAVLGQDAAAASQYPLPACANPRGGYVAAMGDFRAAAADVAADDFQGATAAITRGGDAMAVLTANVRKLGG